MDLRDILKVLHRSWILILICSVLGVLVAGVGSLLVKPTYTSSTRLFVAIQSSGSVSELQQGNTFSQARVQSYVETARTPAVLQPVIDELGLTETPQSLASHVFATADLNTVLITLGASSESPVEAAAIAQAMASSLINAVDELEGSPDSPGSSPVKLSVVTPAIAPEAPASPKVPLNLMAGLIAGFVLSLVVALLRTSLDLKIRSLDDMRKVTDAPLLGGIAYDTDAEKKPLLTQAGHQSPRAESFRQIRTNLQFANIGTKSKTMLITSSLPGEGKSTTATNLAIAMAQAGQRVVLVDADLRRPTVAQYLGLEGNAGLTTCLVGAAEVDDLLQPWGQDNLYVLTSGQIPPNPSELLGSEAMSQLISHLENNFDVVILDAPPLIPVTDANVLAQRVGGVVLVVGAGRIKTRDLESSMSSLELVDANILGVVLNMLATKGPDAYAYSYYSYESRPGSIRPNNGGVTKTQVINGTHSETASAGNSKFDSILGGGN